ncbi:hypothetical protein [Maridesulfovibrio sp.]|uniref:hypothetical protein n=1 Tax=Maridesulfovibrio sp. TaxID=2795000 RepID=UPI003AFF638F
MGYSDIKEDQERSILDDFIEWLNEDDDKYKLVETPDPPDGVVLDKSDDEKFWVEVTSAYFDRAWAEDINSYAAPNREHKDMSGKGFGDMDRKVADEIKAIVQQKMSKSSYGEVYESYGQGILVVKVYSPWTVGGDVFDYLDDLNDINNETGYIGEVYLYHDDGDGYQFNEWE